MEHVSCNLCGADNTRLAYLVRDRLHGFPGTFTLVQCLCCGLIYLNPRPTEDELAVYYPGDYSSYDWGQPGSLMSRFNRWVGMERRARTVLSHVRAGRLLDIGCATGSFLEGMRRHPGWDLYGVDLNSAVAQYAKEHYGLAVHAGTLAQAGFADGFFDVVTMWNVLEHVSDPRATLAEVRRVLRPGGFVIIRVPNADGIGARVFGRFWAGLDAPRHLYVFRRATLFQLLIAEQFQVVRESQLAAGYNTGVLSLGFWLADVLHNMRIVPSVKQILGCPMIRGLLSPIFWLCGLFRHGDIITIVARKPGCGMRTSDIGDPANAGDSYPSQPDQCT